MTPTDAMAVLRAWIRTERQRLRWTQADLARRSGVPSATISRLELTGQGSIEAVFKILFALNRLDAAMDFLKEQRRLAEFPITLKNLPQIKPVLRVRKRKGA